METKKQTCKLSGEDGNAFAILGRVSKSLRSAGVPKDQISKFIADATSGNYDQLLSKCIEVLENNNIEVK